MDTLKRFQNLFEYDYWANREALASIASPAAEKPLKIFSHVIGAQRVWLSRAGRQGASPPQPWPSLSVEEARNAVEGLHREWSAFLNTLDPEKLADNLVYRNSKGVEFRTRLEDVLHHIVIHSAYHRGQVAAAIRENGGKPAPTDYVVYVRQTQ